MVTFNVCPNQSGDALRVKTRLDFQISTSFSKKVEDLRHDNHFKSFQQLSTPYKPTRQDGQNMGWRFPRNWKWGKFGSQIYVKSDIANNSSGKLKETNTFYVSHLPAVFLTIARPGWASPIPLCFTPCLNCQPQGPCAVGDRSRRFRLPPPDIHHGSYSGQPVSCHKTSGGFTVQELPVRPPVADIIF